MVLPLFLILILSNQYMPKKKRQKHVSAPRLLTTSAHDYFAAGLSDRRLFHFIIDTVLVGDYAVHIAETALAGIDKKDRKDPPQKLSSPTELARVSPGSRTKRLRDQSQELLELFLSRGVDNFNRYLVDLIRAVLRQQPSILKSKQQSLTLEEILSHSTIGDLVHSIIEARVSGLSYEGFDSVVDWCGDRGIPIQVPDGKYDDVKELIATRNLIAHSRCVVDERYIRAIKATPFRIGEKRTLEVDDLYHAMELLDGTVIATDIGSAKKFRIKRVRIKNMAPKDKRAAHQKK